MFRGLRMALDILGQVRLLKGKLSKKAIAALQIKHTTLECCKCNSNSKVTLRKYSSDTYICTDCNSKLIPSRRERRQG